MAKKDDSKERKVVLERTYIIPLRKRYQRAPLWKRTPRAVKAVKEFVERHMKSETVKIGKHLNLRLWKDGMKNPPHKVKVDCQKDEDGTVNVEIFGAPKEKPKEDKKVTKKEKAKETKPEVKKDANKDDIEIQVKDALSGKEEESKKAEKEELKTIAKEQPKAPKQAAQPKQVQQQPNAPASKG